MKNFSCSVLQVSTFPSKMLLLRTRDYRCIGVVYVSKMPFSHGRQIVCCCSLGGNGQLSSSHVFPWLNSYFFNSNKNLWWGVGGRFRREGTDVYLWLIHVAVQQEPTQHYKAIILQLKVNSIQ